MATSDTTFFSSKSYSLRKLAIIAPGGRIDVTQLLESFSLYEDLYSATLSGEVTLSDSNDLINNLQMNGFEYLVVSLGKPGIDQEIQKIFRIYKIDQHRIKDNQSNQIFCLRFCSEEVLTSASNKVFRSYKGFKISDIIQDVLKNGLRVNSNRLSKIEETKGQYDLIIPGMYPLDAIMFASSRTYPAAFFFESNRGFNFISINSLVSQDTKQQYRYVNPNISALKDQNSNYGLFNCFWYEFMDVYDSLEAISGGLYASSLLTLDLIRQTVQDYKFDYLKEFQKNPHLEDKPLDFTSQHTDVFNKRSNENAHSFWRYYPTTKNHNSDQNITGKQPGIRQNLIENWMLQRVSTIESLNYLKLKLAIPGNPNLAVGDIIEFGVPIMGPKDLQGDNLNKRYSGRFLITAIRWIVNLQTFEMIIEATKDCYSGTQ